MKAMLQMKKIDVAKLKQAVSNSERLRDRSVVADSVTLLFSLRRLTKLPRYRRTAPMKSGNKICRMSIRLTSNRLTRESKLE
jgi:hypothetical protein